MRKRFFSINIILRSVILYSLLAVAITAIYFGFIFIMFNYFKGISRKYALFVGFAFFGFFVIVLDPLKDYLRNSIDKMFFKIELDYEKTLKDTSAAMALLTDMERLLKLTARIVARRMKLRGAVLFLFDEKRNRYELRGAEGACRVLQGTTLSPNYPIIEAMEEGRDVIVKSEIEKKMSNIFLSEFEKKKYGEILSDFSRLKITLVVPSMLKNRLIAFLGLGEKLSEDPFTAEDINFLITLSNQSAISIGNSMLLEKEKESAKKLAEAQTLEKYAQTLEKMNKELIDTREELVKMERFSTVTKFTISLQHEINNPLTSVLAQTQGLLLKMENDPNVSLDFIREHLHTIEKETKRIRELLRNLAHITEPVVREYMPGVDMIDIKASAQY